jgi:RimJ/RimL family protein N-acetyltransferase
MAGGISFKSPRLQLSEFEMSDSEDVYASITPALPRYMFWEPPQSLEAYKARRQAVLDSSDKSGYSFVIRRLDTTAFLGIASLENLHDTSPEVGIWIRESEHGNGFGTEAVIALAGWASSTLKKSSFIYATAVENAPSRRIVEKLGGTIVGTRTSPKYDSVVYRFAWNADAEARS